MPKEDRSSWVAVAPEFSLDQHGASTDAKKIKPPQSAYAFFQKDMTEQVKAETIANNNGKFEVGLFSRAMRDRWNDLDADAKKPYEEQATRDQYRFRSESHQADVAAIERRERLQRERQTLLLDDRGGTKRSTRGGRAKKERKEKRKEKKINKSARNGFNRAKVHDDDDEDFVDAGDRDDDDAVGDNSDDGSGDNFSLRSGDESSDSDDDDSSEDIPNKKKKKNKPAARQPSQKQIEHRKKIHEEKEKKEAVIAEQQDDIRKEKAQQANKRLEFLLKQSNIFSHFGQVKEDQAKYGIKGSVKREQRGSSERNQNSSRRDPGGDENKDEELEEADEHQATFLTSQPTTLGFGKMRDYQLEGLNWMIRLQENGVNGILADEVSLKFQFLPSHCADT
jgi:hypothetical protein